MERQVLAVTARNETGTQAAKRIRKQGMVPGVVYGRGIEALPIEVGTKALRDLLHVSASGHTFVDLELSGEGGAGAFPTMIKEIQRHPITRKILNVDFQRISLTEKIHAMVQVVLRGEAPGVKLGGVLEHFVRDVEVECLPGDVPDRIVVDVGSLNIHDTVHVRDLPLPVGVIMLRTPEEIVAVVAPPTVATEEVTAVPEGEAQPAEPEVIKQKREKEEE